MHGIIFSELKRFAETRFGPDAWGKLLAGAGLNYNVFLATETYPDEQAVAIAAAASKASGLPMPALLEGFGEFIVPSLLKVYGSLVKPQWRTLDILEHTEGTIHKVVRMKNPGASPPRLSCSRIGPDEVVITYTSARKLCALAKGIIKGVAGHYREKVAISESSCMLTGGASCLLSVRRLPL